MRTAKKHSFLTKFSLGIAVPLTLTGISTMAHGQNRCPKDDLSLPTDHWAGFGRGYGIGALDLTIGWCAITMEASEKLGSPLKSDIVWPGAGVAAPIFRTKYGITIGDLIVPAGTYSLYLLPSQNGWKLIVNKDSSAIQYDEAKDLGRVAMTTVAAPTSPTEKLLLHFTAILGKTCVGRCDPRKGPYLPRGQLGQPQIRLVWDTNEAYVDVKELEITPSR